MSVREIRNTIASLRTGDDKINFKTVTRTINKMYSTDYKEPSVRRMFYEWEAEQESYAPTIVGKTYNEDVPVTLGTVDFMVIPDVHLPFVSAGFIEFCARVRDKYRLNSVFCIGDLLDYNAISFWESNPDGFSASTEYYKSIPQLIKMASLFPEMRITLGNHDIRPQRVARKAGLPSFMIRHPNEIIEGLSGADVTGWDWQVSYLVNGNTLVEHGEHAGLKATYDKALLTSLNVIQGHTHSYGGVMYINDGYTKRYALNVGCGIDAKAYAFYYAKNHKMKPTLGCGIVKDGVPQFIPMN